MASDTEAVPTPGYHRPPMPAPRRRPAIKEAPVEQRPGEALIWTDGACSGNPGPGGWAAIVVPADGGEPVELSGGEHSTTNNRMELTAALEGLRSLPAGSDVCVVTDSLLLLKSMTIWIGGWKRRGWKTAGGAPVKNQDLVLALEAEIGRHATVRWQWVKGHAQNGFNDRADSLAVAAARAAAA
jgi:ribonuclease HI